MRNANEPLLHNLAHELRQPLSTIESIAYYLELIYPSADPHVREQLTRLRHLVEQSGWIINDALSVSQNAPARPQVVDLDEIVSEFVLEQMQQDTQRPQFYLALNGEPAWIDYRQGREMVHAICRLFRTMARPGAAVNISTRVLANGSMLMLAETERLASDECSLPSGTNLTIESIEKLAALNESTVFIQLGDPSRVELGVEVPIARQCSPGLAELAEALPSCEGAGQLEPAAPGIL